MSEFFRSFGEEATELLSFFVTVALLQNVILTAGFGSSVMLHMVRKPKNIWLFSGILAIFSVLTVAIAYPFDMLLGTELTHYWRPMIVVGITILLYVIATLLLKWLAPNFYHRVALLMPMAAFNNLVVGIALVCNSHFPAGLGGNIGLAVGSALGFGILTWLTAEGIERMDNPDMPEAFRGMPSTLLYVGICALALLGFGTQSFI